MISGQCQHAFLDDAKFNFLLQDSRKEYDVALNAYKPQKKKKDPNEPKQPLSAYFLFSQVRPLVGFLMKQLTVVAVR